MDVKASGEQCEAAFRKGLSLSGVNEPLELNSMAALSVLTKELKPEMGSYFAFCLTVFSVLDSFFFCLFF